MPSLRLPLDVEPRDVGNIRKSDRPLDTALSQSAVEKPIGSLSSHTTGIARSYANSYLRAVTYFCLFLLAGAAPVELPDTDTATPQYSQTLAITVVCVLTFSSAAGVWLTPLERWHEALYVVTLCSAIGSLVILSNWSSEAKVNQVWIVLASLCLYAAWLRRLSNTYKSKRKHFTHCCVGVLVVLVFAIYSLGALKSSSFDSFPVTAPIFLSPFSIFAVCCGYAVQAAWPRIVLYIRTIPTRIRTALLDALSI